MKSYQISKLPTPRWLPAAFLALLLSGLVAHAATFVQPTIISGTTASGLQWSNVATGTALPIRTSATSVFNGAAGAVAYFDTQTGQLQIDPKGLSLTAVIFTYTTGTVNISGTTPGPFTYTTGTGTSAWSPTTGTSRTFPAVTVITGLPPTTFAARVGTTIGAPLSPSLATSGDVGNIASDNGFWNKPWSFPLDLVNSGSVSSMVISNFKTIGQNSNANANILGYGLGFATFQYAANGIVGNQVGPVIPFTLAPTSTALYWLGSEGDSWTASNNWATDLAGTPTGNFTAGSDIIFSSANSTNSANTDLGGDLTIGSLTINSTAPVGISGGNLTINGTTTAAITVNATAGNVTISAPLILSGSSSTLSIENANTTLASITSANGLVKTGNGTVEIQNRIWVSELGGNLDVQSGNFVSRDGLSLGVGASNETATISGNTTSFSSPTTLNVGYSGNGNTLAIENGATASAGSVWIGGNSSAANNSVTVNGSSLTSSAGGSIAVGYAGSNNTFNISNGGSADSTTAYIGYESTANNNTATVTGANSTWTNTGALFVGFNGTGNALFIQDGGSVQNSNSDVQIGFNAGSNNNSLTINGTGSGLGAGANATLYVGNNGAGNTLSVTNGGNLTTFNSRIGGAASSNNNTLTVSGTGSAWDNTGTLQVGTSGSGNRLNLLNGATATVAGDIFIGYNTGSANNTITVNGTDSVLTAGNLTVGRHGSGTLAVNNGGKVVVLGGIVKGNSSTVAIGQGGTLQLGNGGAGGLLGISALQSNGTIIANSSSSYSYNGSISGTGNFIKDGTGTLTVAGTQTYSGGTAVNAGTLALGASNLLLNTGNLSVAGGSFDIGTFQQALKNVTLSSGSIDGTSGTITAQSYAVESGLISAKLAGNASLTKSTNGTVTLSGSNTYTGNTTINEGALVIASTGQIAPSIAPSITNQTGFAVAGENSTASVTLDGGSISNFAGYIGFGNGSTGTVNINSGNWTNSDNLRVGYYGNGTLNLTGGNVSNADGIIGRYSTGVANVSGGTWTSSGSMTIGREATGTLNLTGGNVVVGSGAGNITIARETASTGTLNLGNGSTAGSLQAARVTGGNGTAVVNFNHTGNLSFAPILDGSLSVNKLGDGTLTLSGNNSYAGGTFIESGTLTGNNLGLKGNITNNATLLLGTAGTFQLNTSGAGNFVVAAGNNNEVKLLGNATMAGGTTIQSGTLTIGGSVTYDSPYFVGSITGDIANEGLLKFDLSSDAGNRTYSGVMSGNGSLLTVYTRSNPYGKLFITGNNTYTGGTTVNYGTVDISGGSLASTGNVTLAQTGTLAIGASNQSIGTLLLKGDQNASATGSGFLTASRYDLRQGTAYVSLAGTADIEKNSYASSGTSAYSQGVVYLSGNNISSGNITISGGILSFDKVQSLFSGNNSSWTPSKITVTSNATSPFTSTLSLGTGEGNNPTAGFNNAQIEEIFENLTANGTGGLTANSSIGFNVGGGNFTLNTTITDRPDGGKIGMDKIGGGKLVLSANNTFTGPLNIFEGFVEAGTDNALSVTSSLVIDSKGGTTGYNVGNFSQQFVNVTLLSGTLAGGTGTINATGNYTMVKGDSTANIAGVAPLIKTGNGIVYLYGNSSYTGHTTVNGSYSWTSPTASESRLQFQNPGSLYSDDASKWNGGNITVNPYGIFSVRADDTGAQGFTENRIATLITNLISANRTSGGLLAGSAFGIDTAGTNMTLSTAFTDSTDQVPDGGAIGFVKYGAGTLTLNGTNNTHTLVTSVTGGTLALAPGTTLSASSANLSVQNASLDLGTTSQTLALVEVSNGFILGSGTLTATAGDFYFRSANITANLAGNVGAIISQGTTTLGGNNTHTGNTTVYSATLSLANLNAVAASTLVANLGSSTQFALAGGNTYNLGGLGGEGNIAFGNNTLSIGANNQSTSYGSSTGSLSGTGSVVKVGNGTLTFAGNNNYSGGTTISAGTLALGSGGTAGSVTGDITNNATLVFNRSDNSTYSGIVSGNGSVTKNGAGLLTLSGNSTYTGNTTINSGTLGLSGALASTAISIASSAGLNTIGGISEDAAVANSGNFTVNAADTIGSLSGSGNTILNAALTTGALGTADEISGSITGNASLTKAGNGTLSLSGSNTYNGSTTVSAGTLAVTGSLNGTSSLNINAGSVNANSGNLTVSGNISVGESSSNNTLQISNGGAVRGYYMSAGHDLGANNNQVTVGANSKLTLTDKFDVGFDGSSNNLTITNGGQVSLGAGGSSIGSFRARDNSVLIDGSGSKLTNTGIYFVGFQGEGNQLTLSNQGRLVSDYLSVGGSYAVGVGSGSNNTVLVTNNASMLVHGELTVGGLGSSNSMAISEGGNVTSVEGSIGRESISSNNTVTVTGTNSTWTNTGTLRVGWYGSNNTLTVANNGTVTASSISIASQGGSGGTLNIGTFGGNDTGGTINASSIAFGSGAGKINFNQSNAMALSGNITGNGSVNKLGSGTTTLSGNSTYTGGTTISGGTLSVTGSVNGTTSVQVNVASSLAITGAVTTNGSVNANSGTITIGQGGALVVSGSTTTSQTIKALLASNRSNYTIAALNLEDSNAFVTSFGNSTVTNAPAGIAFGPNGNIYVASNGANSISIFAPDGTYTGNITGNLNQPHGLAFDSTGNLYVANYGSNSTSIFAPNGTYTGNITANLHRPTDVVFDSEGKLYISNDGSNSISVFAPNGTYTGNITGNLNRPYSMALGSNGSLYVVNNNNSSVSIFSLTGNLTGNITSNLSNPFGSVVNSNGDLYVANYNTSNISIYSSNGAYLSNIALGFVPYGLAIGNFTAQVPTLAGITLAASASDNATLNLGAFGGNDTTATLTAPFIAFGSGTAALNLNLASNYTLSSDLTGGNSNSTINQLGTGITTLASTNSTYTGKVNVNNGTLVLATGLANTTSTTISTGTLQLGTGGTTGSIAGNILNNGTLAIHRSNDLVFSNTVTGTGSILKLGNNTLTYNSGNVTPQGGTTISSGKLLVTGTTSAVTINNSGILAGSGTVGAVTVNSGGTIAPGTSPGTITTGNMTWNGGGIYNWELASANGTNANGTDWDLIDSSGNLTIGANATNPFFINASTTNASVFNPNAKYSSWKIADFADGIPNFSSDAFSVNATGFANLPAIYGFGVSANATALNFVYATAVTWTGVTGNWTTAANWENSFAPINVSVAPSTPLFFERVV